VGRSVVVPALRLFLEVRDAVGVGLGPAGGVVLERDRRAARVIIGSGT
jgi:hypothetical protein